MNNRVHFADNLRAVAMLLGIFLHASVPFALHPGGWPMKDASTHPAFDLFILFVHAFRLPVFFLITGFFARLLYQRVGPAAFLRHRAKRIFLPFLLGMMTIAPLSQAVGIYGGIASLPPPARPNPLKAVAGYFVYGGFFQNLSPFHLWFLYYLLYFYAFAVLFAALSGRPPAQRALHIADAFISRVSKSLWKPLAFACFTLPTLYLMRSWNADSTRGLVVEGKILAFYGVFFAFGWLLQRQPTLLAEFRRGAWLYLAVGVLAVFPIYIAILSQAGKPTALLKFAALSTYASTVWLLTLGLFGLFIRYLDTPHAGLRYVADSSYWLYLIHYPLLGYLVVLFAGVPLPSGVKFLLILATSIPLMLASYHYGVRYTWVGGLLNGKRRRGPAASASPSAEPAALPTR
ncbi:MAG: acyltransferase family protein [Acidobacteriota bacterium]|nr:acyltransferase family protein [Acidobacteriota bacterium]